MPFLFVAGLGLVIMFVANAYLLSREYFLLAAMRFRPPAEAKAMRSAHRGQIFMAGLLIAMFVSIPIVNLATPLFAMAMMVHMHKRLSTGARDRAARTPTTRRPTRQRAITVFPGHLHISAITHFSHSGLRARQM